MVIAKESDVTFVTIAPVDAFTQELKTEARRLGFVLSGVAPAAAPQRLQAFHRWLDAGMAGQMSYLPDRRQAYTHPRHVLDGCRTILMLGLPYDTASSVERRRERLRTRTSRANSSRSTKDHAGKVAGDEMDRQHTTGARAKIAKYAAGQTDYHDVIHERLERLKQWLRGHYPEAAVRGVVDTAPLLERELAELAGLGWVGKNTLLLNRQWGSYFFLAALLTDLDLAVDPPNEEGYCGTCTACLEACPTDAFPEPYVLDATQCISYLTIEHRGPLPDALRGELDGWVFGCDVCQQVCPWNSKAAGSQEAVFEPRADMAECDLQGLLELNEEQFRAAFRRTPLWRAKRRGLLRNAILVAGQARDPSTFTALCRLLADEEALIRGAAAWAVAQFDFPEARTLLAQRKKIEEDPTVRQALDSAMWRTEP